MIIGCKKIEFKSFADHPCRIFYIHLDLDVLSMTDYGMETDKELMGDFMIRIFKGYEPKNFQLPVSQQLILENGQRCRLKFHPCKT